MSTEPSWSFSVKIPDKIPEDDYQALTQKLLQQQGQAKYNTAEISDIDEMSEDDYRAHIQELLQQYSQGEQESKDITYSTLLIALGGLSTLSFLIFGDLISLGSVDLAVRISLIAFALALPLLAASFWSLKLWYGTPILPPNISMVTEQQFHDVRPFSRPARPQPLPPPLTTYQAVRFERVLDGPNLWIIFLAAGVTFFGVFTALWHAFWVASIVFLLAIIVACVLVGISFGTFMSKLVTITFKK